MATLHKYKIGDFYMKWIKYQVHTTTDDADTIGDILTELGIYGFEITDHVPLSENDEKKMYTDIPADLGPDDGKSVLTFYTEAPDNTEKDFYSTGSSIRDAEMNNSTPVVQPDELIKKIKKKVKAKKKYFKITVPFIEYSIEDDSQWKDKWKENFKPFRVADDIIIKPTWEDIPDYAGENDIILEIDPGSAFGTGTHETTKLCLQSLRKYIKDTTTILDAGCGSGILAISSLLCGAKSAYCLDIDPCAVEATIENASINHIDSERIKAINANILEDTSPVKEMCNGQVDIAVANILADVIIPLSECIGDFIKPGGLFISSGILLEKADDVEKALLDNNFTIIEKNTLGEWASFVATNKK